MKDRTSTRTPGSATARPDASRRAHLRARFEAMARDQTQATIDTYRGATPERHARDFEATCRLAAEILRSRPDARSVLRSQIDRDPNDLAFWIDLVRRARQGRSG